MVGTGSDGGYRGEETTARESVLFLCIRNSARSQMAEALLRHMAGDRFTVVSAGLVPRDIHPLTLKVLRERGIDTSQLRSKSLKEFLGTASYRYAIIVCEKAAQNCPQIFPFALHVLSWPFEDPMEFSGSEKATIDKFREVRDRIEARLRKWLDADRS